MKEFYDCIWVRYGAESGSYKTYMLTDGTTITDGAGRFHCTEVLYFPSFISTEACGFHDTSLLYNTRCVADTRKFL